MRKKNVLIIVETSRAFGRGLLEGISQYLLETNCWNIHVEDRGLLEATPSWFKNWKGDGIISRTSSLSVARSLGRLNVPVVELLGNGKQVKPEVRNDESQAALFAVEHFAYAGFRDYAFFSVGNAWWSQLRQEHFVREVREHGGSVHVFPHAGAGERVFYPSWELKYEKAMLRWLRQLPKPIGVWAVSDALAIRLLEGCRRLDIAVPEDIAILGTTNDTLLCKVLTPALSSIDMNSAKIGYAAAERLADKMKGKTVGNAPVLVTPTGVITRQSTDIVAMPDRELAAAVRFIRQKALKTITVDRVAKAVGISRSTLQRRFRKVLDRTVEMEIMRIRMERAKQLLRETNFSLSAIAEDIGFATKEYFVQAFRREMGITPHLYRQTMVVIPSEPE